MKRISLMLMLLILIFYQSSRAEEFRRWKYPGGDPSGLDSLAAIDYLPGIPQEVKESWRNLVQSEQWERYVIHKGDTLQYLGFGGKKKGSTHRHWNMTICDWVTVDSLTARAWTTSFYDTLETADSIKCFEARWSFVRVDTCGNETYLTEFRLSSFLKAKPREAPPPPSAPPPSPPKEPKLSIQFIAEASHWNNDQDPWIRYEEAKLGLRLRYPKSKSARLFLEADFWPLMARFHTVNNGFDHSVQFPLFQVQPKLVWRPSDHWFFMGAYNPTFSLRGLDSSTGMLMNQILLFNSGAFEPMLQFAGSTTDSKPRFLQDTPWTEDQYPESSARYQEIKARLQIFRFGNLRLGYEATWFGFQKNSLDSLGQDTGQKLYEATGRPAYGGPYLQYELPWHIYLDLSVAREHIDNRTFIIQDESASWIDGDVEEWRVNLVISRGFRLDLLK